MPATLQTLRSGATSHPEEIVNFLTARFVEVGGVFDKSGGELLCEEQGAPDMTVKVNEGNAFVRKTDGSMAYPVRLYDGAYNATITSNASGNPRIDAIVLYIDLGASANSGATNVAKIAVVAGTPAASPVAPTYFAIGTAIGASNPFIRLAHVTVSSGASEIDNANITDMRQQVRASQKLDFAKTGDVKMSIRGTADEGWLLMNDDTIGDIGSGATHEGAHFEDLFALLQSDFGQTPTAAWGSGGKIIVPAMGGKTPVGYKSTDSDYNALAKTGGVKTINIEHAHTIAHAHDMAHTHTIAHTHTFSGTTGNNTAGPSRDDGSYGAAPQIHSHPFSGTTDGASTGNSGGVSTPNTGGSSAANSGNAGSTTQDIKTPYRVFNFQIKW